MFLGNFVHTLDEKMRLSMPARYREKLSSGIVMTTGAEKCLLVYPMNEFALLFEKVSVLPIIGKDAATLRRMLFMNANDASPDKQNRVVLPQALRDYAAIKSEVVIVGVGKFIELWSPEEWNTAQQEIAQAAVDKDAWAKLGI
jgi:MraZ protein